MSTQAPTHRCHCGREVPVVPASAWEFDWRCGACPASGRIAWAHWAPPPVFGLRQPSLFEGAA